MVIDFAIDGWSACAPRLRAQSDWEAWSRAPWVPVDGDLASLTAMAPMLRRRLGPLGQVALGAVYACAGDEALPMVFASRHGDVARTAQMLADVAVQAPLSPTAFALSVHNAIGAMYSIDRRHVAVQQAVSAGRETAEAALVEAGALLADGHDTVLVVCCDAPLPTEYAGFADEPDALYGWAWRVCAPRAGLPRFSLAREVGVDVKADVKADVDAGAECSCLPHGLDVLRFMLSADRCLRWPVPGGAWQWRRHA